MDFKEKLTNEKRVKVEISFVKRAKKENAIYSFWAIIPSYVNNTLGRIKVVDSEDFIIYKYPLFFGKTRDGYLWMGRVKGGKQGDFYYTPKRAVWAVRYARLIETEGSFKRLTVKFLDLFDDVLFQKVKLKRIIYPQKYKKEGDYIVAEYTSVPRQLKLSLYAEVIRDKESTLFDKDINIKRALQISAEDRTIIKKILKTTGWKIGKAPQFDKAAFLSHKVHEYIKYDYSLSGAKLNLKQISKLRRGVCEEYATLLVALLRYFDIPALFAEGYAFTNYKEQYGWGPHVFVLAQVDGRWRYFDPTWDINSGLVPASHIVFRLNYERRDEIKAEYEYLGSPPKVKYYDPVIKILRFK